MLELRELLAPTDIWLFGSRARGDHRPDSDWDLLAVLPDDADDRLCDPILAWRIGCAAPLPTTVLTTKSRELAALWGLPNTIGYDVARDGVRLIVG